MLKNALQKLVGQKDSVKSHDVIRLQAKTYRLTKYFFNELLKEHTLSTLDWSILGLLNESQEGIRYTNIAKRMGVEPPFVTELVSKLEKKKMVISKDSPLDKRAKQVLLTKKGHHKLDDIEKAIDTKMNDFFASISSSDLQTYRNVMKKMEDLLEKNN